MVPRKDPFRNFRFRLEIDGIQKNRVQGDHWHRIRG